MADLFDGSPVAIPFDDLSSFAHGLSPLSIDPWLASSLLQKSIRRGDADMAVRAALTLFRMRPGGIWRRFMVIAFEDIGAAAIEAVVRAVTAGTDPRRRADVGGDERVVPYIARLLANAPKDRSADHLICSGRSHAPLEDTRRMVGSCSIIRRLHLVADRNQPLHARAIAAWYSSGVEWDDERRVGKGDLPGLTSVFRSLGVPNALALATGHAAIHTREPIVIMVPLIWLEAFREGPPAVLNCPLPASPVINDVPLYALDKHTAIGKAAIHRFARENDCVREILAEHVPEYRAQEAACMAAFYADGAPVSRRLDWCRSVELEAMGIESDLRSAGVTPGGDSPVLDAVRGNLDHLNEIRARLFSTRRRS